MNLRDASNFFHHEDILGLEFSVLMPYITLCYVVVWNRNDMANYSPYIQVTISRFIDIEHITWLGLIKFCCRNTSLERMSVDSRPMYIFDRCWASCVKYALQFKMCMYKLPSFHDRIDEVSVGGP